MWAPSFRDLGPQLPPRSQGNGTPSLAWNRDMAKKSLVDSAPTLCPAMLHRHRMLYFPQ